MRIRNSKASGRKRLAAAVGALLAAGGLVTAAAFTDLANLNIGNGTDGSGIGGNNRFNVQVVATDENGVPIADKWQEADTVAGVNIQVPGAGTLTPGDTIQIDIPFRNVSPALGAELTFTLQDRPGYTSNKEIAEALRYTVSVGEKKFATNAPQKDVKGLALGTYAAGAQGVLSVSISLPDQGSKDKNNALQGLVSYVQAHFDASSVQP